jgi:RNA polymerase sigma-70 factor (ECF subfamily)
MQHRHDSPVLEEEEFKLALSDCISYLGRIARLFNSNRSACEDLVQDTLLRALANRHRFRAGTNLRTWLTTILRNHFLNLARTSKRNSEISLDEIEGACLLPGNQEAAIEFREFTRALRRLPPSYQEAVLLVGANGLTYREAADLTGCSVGTMKSRVSRARAVLTVDLHGVESMAGRL